MKWSTSTPQLSRRFGDVVTKASRVRFGDRRLSSEPVIGVGDSVSVTIWEASAGGLFSAPLLPDKLSVGSNSAMIPEQVVGRDGGITVPYAGRIHVAGQTTRAVQRTIEKALAGKAIEPQVLVNVVRPVSDSVSVVGEVTAGSRIPLSVRGDRLLDVIAEAGGVKAPVNETFVELTRGSATARMPLTTIIASPGEDVYLHPNDVLTLVRDPQTFIAYGATGRNAEIPFDADGINLAQALAKAGGLLDDRSDPRGSSSSSASSPNLCSEPSARTVRCLAVDVSHKWSIGSICRIPTVFFLNRVSTSPIAMSSMCRTRRRPKFRRP